MRNLTTSERKHEARKKSNNKQQKIQHEWSPPLRETILANTREHGRLIIVVDLWLHYGRAQFN